MPERCPSWPRFIAGSVFWVFCPCPASERSMELPAVGGFGKDGGNPFGSGQAQPRGLGPAFPRALFTYPPSSAGLALGTSHCVLGDSLAPNSPGNSGYSGFQGHFQFYSSGKIFAVCLMVCSEPWLLGETAFCWLPPLPGSHGPTDQELPGPAGSRSFLCPSPQRCPSDSVGRHRPHWDPGGRTKQTGS